VIWAYSVFGAGGGNFEKEHFYSPGDILIYDLMICTMYKRSLCLRSMSLLEAEAKKRVNL
jgi:hypothetical protein